MDAAEILARLHNHADPRNVAGMARYGINTKGTLGVSVALIRGMAKQIGRNQTLAQELWDSGIHEARILATIIADPARVTKRQMDQWARDFDSWDVCDQACQNLFRDTPHAWDMAVKWAGARREFVRRAGFSLMAGLAVRAKDAPDERFLALLPLIAGASTDERNMVKKAVNWALRAIGKKNALLRARAISTAESIARIDSRSARWIAADALRELKRARTKVL
jgi:3-methyladenine DNA glycosylase AlkD